MRSLLILLLLTSTARADDLTPPAWLLTAGGGLTLQNGYDPEAMADSLTIGGAAGGILDVRHVGDGYAIYGELDGFFAGSIYGGRVGVITGRRTAWSYREVVDVTKLGSTTANGVTTTTYRTTSNVYADNVRGAWGLDLSASARTLDGSGAFMIEAGLGLLGQLQLELQLTYDVVHAAPGIRIQTIITQGQDASWCMRVSVESLFSLNASPMPGLISLTFGGGPGYHPNTR